MKYFLLIILVLIIPGCFYLGMEQYGDVLNKKPCDWNYRDCLTILATQMSHNFFDFQTNVKVAITPYTPKVVMAIQRNAQRVYHWNDAEFRDNVNELLRLNNGLFFDWESERLVDARGNFYRSSLQLDSLMFLITIVNNAWTSINSSMEVKIVGNVSAVVPLISFDQVYMPSIEDIDDRIFMLNDNGDTLRPHYIYGRKNNLLITEETMFAMFYFNKDRIHFLGKTKKIKILIKGFEKDIWLNFPINYLEE